MKQLCACGCGKTFEWKKRYKTSPKKFIKGHHNKLLKNKTYEERFGKEKAKRLKSNLSIINKKTYEERFGKEKADSIKEKISKKAKRTLEEKCGKKKAKEITEKRTISKNKKRCYQKSH